MSDSTGGLTTAQLAQRTGVAAGTLRMWESRHGFPASARGSGGHRRYSEADVELVRAVVRLRREGLSLTAAIRRASAELTVSAASIFAGLAERRGDLQSITLHKRALLALSHAIEDDHCARAAGGVLVGSFQKVRFYRQSERRWQELARTASLAVALADFKHLRQPARRPVEVPVRSSEPVAREWVIAFLTPGASACLAAWEIPQPTVVPDRERMFEVLWSPEPEVAATAVGVAAEVITDAAPAIARRLRAALEEPAAPSPPELRVAVGQAHRMLAYLGDLVDGAQ